MENHDIEVEIRRKNSSARLRVSDANNLEGQLSRLSEILTMAESLASIWERAEENTDIYRLGFRDEVVLVARVGQELEKIGLVLFARFPLSVKREAFSQYGINPSTLRTTLSKHSDYFRSEGEGGPVMLTASGFEWINKDILPAIRQRLKTTSP